MGLFKARRSLHDSKLPTSSGASEFSKDEGVTTQSRAFYAAMKRGDLDAGAALLGTEGTQHGTSLLDYAERADQAVRAGNLDEAASLLESWHSPYESEYSTPWQRARMNALGLCLIRYFAHPDARACPSSESLLNGIFRNLSKEAHRSGEIFFGDVWARTKAGW